MNTDTPNPGFRPTTGTNLMNLPPDNLSLHHLLALAGHFTPVAFLNRVFYKPGNTIFPLFTLL